MSSKKIYHIEISQYKTDRVSEPSVYMIELQTDNLEWSMDQYQRNREPLTYRVIAENYISKDNGSKADDSSSV